MRPDTVRGYARAKPFRPFRIVLNSGRAYEIRHPELISVGRDSFLYFLGEDPEATFHRYVTVSLLHIGWIEFIESAATAATPSVSAA